MDLTTLAGAESLTDEGPPTIVPAIVPKKIKGGALMRLKAVLALAAVSLLGGVSAHAAAVVRVIVVETPDVAAYAKALDQGKTLMKSKGVPANLRILRARFAGDKAGSIVVTAEYASLEELAKADATMSSDAELRAWLQSLGKLRKIVSDSLYEDVVP